MNWYGMKKEAMIKRCGVIVAAFGLCFFLMAGDAIADVTEDESGVCLGLTLAGASLHSDATSDEFHVKDHGGALQLSLGYRFNPVFTLELAIGGSKHDTSVPSIDAGVASVQILGYYRFLPEKSFRPYLKGGFAGYSLVLDAGSVDLRINGGGIAFGGGVRAFLSPIFSIGVDLTHNMIKYDDAKLSLGDLSFQSSIEEHGRLTTLGLTFGLSL